MSDPMSMTMRELAGLSLEELACLHIEVDTDAFVEGLLKGLIKGLKESVDE